MGKTFEESMSSIAASVKRSAQAAYPGSAFRLGEVKEAGADSLRIACDGLELDNDDLWVNPALMQGYSPKLVGTLTGTCTCGAHTGVATTPVHKDDQTRGETGLKPGDRVVLLVTGDGQSYYVLCKVVKL